MINGSWKLTKSNIYLVGTFSGSPLEKQQFKITIVLAFKVKELLQISKKAMFLKLTLSDWADFKCFNKILDLLWAFIRSIKMLRLQIAELLV